MRKPSGLPLGLGKLAVHHAGICAGARGMLLIDFFVVGDEYDEEV